MTLKRLMQAIARRLLAEAIPGSAQLVNEIASPVKLARNDGG